MITQSDIKLLGKTFVTKDDLEGKLQSLKSVLLNVLDQILTEVRASREEETILSNRVSDHEDRIAALENPTD